MSSTSSLSSDGSESVYLDVQAALGITKHMGGLASTEELARLCHIGAGKDILDVGCGSGKTACFLARTYGCRIVAVDIKRAMLERAKERARRVGLGHDQVEFRLADALNLPFDEHLFDVTISESVAAFVEDKAEAVREYTRVTRPDGYVGLNETTWIKDPPPSELVEYVLRTTGARPETAAAWQEMLAHAGLRDVQTRTHTVDMLSEWINEMKWLDLRDLLGPWFRLLHQYLINPDAREFVRMLRPQPEHYFDYFGYGTYVGRR